MDCRFIVVVLLCCFCWVDASRECYGDQGNATGLPSDACSFDLRMKGAHPNRPDQYFCAGYDVQADILHAPDQSQLSGYIVKYEALADAGTAHHILVFGCETPYKTQGVWSCGQVCSTGEQIVFAWAKNADPLSLPKDVGYKIGAGTKINHIVVQIHYSKELSAPDTSGIRIFTTLERQQYISGIFLLVAFSERVPPQTKGFTMDISCRFTWSDSIVPIGFRTHAHGLGTVISGYKVNKGNFQLIGKGNPQWPQAFYPVTTNVVINPGDDLVARCVYDSTGRDRYTKIGSTSKDEMCNFYIMYYTNSSRDSRVRVSTCAGDMEPFVTMGIPEDSVVPLPPNPRLEDVAMGDHHHQENDGPPTINVEPLSKDFSASTPGVTNQGKDSVKLRQGLKGEKGQKGSGSQGLKHFSTSFGDGAYSDSFAGNGLLNVGRGDRYTIPQQPSPYLFDYSPDYSEPDYYDIMQQRRRNKAKSPYYDLYDSQRGYGIGDVPDRTGYQKSYPSLSRNRNKIFNEKYDDYAVDNLQGSPSLSRGSGTRKGSNSPGTLIKGGNSKEAQSKGDMQDSEKAASSSVSLNHDLDLRYVSAFNDYEIGQVGGLATSKSGDLYVFHRGSRVWNSLSFNNYNSYQLRRDPVEVEAILVFGSDGKLKRKFGENMYFLPHGLTLDSNENMWLTDVALHQVFRIPAGKTEPDMTLGIRFEPGKDSDHFCKPSDVAVLANGEFFVSDGYCNSRIIHFDANGYRKKTWGKSDRTTMADGFPAPGTFYLPHGLTLAEDKGLLCVADRENGRIQCFDLNGNFVRQMHPPQFGTALYALEYCPNHGGVLFAVNGPVSYRTDPDTQGFTLDINTGNLLSMWNIPGEGMTHPHDVAVDTDRHLVYVGELNPRKVWKFEMTKALLAENKTSGDTGNSVPSVTGGSVTIDNHQAGSEIVDTQPADVEPSMKPVDGDVVKLVDTISHNNDLSGHTSEQNSDITNDRNRFNDRNKFHEQINSKHMGNEMLSSNLNADDFPNKDSEYSDKVLGKVNKFKPSLVPIPTKRVLQTVKNLFEPSSPQKVDEGVDNVKPEKKNRLVNIPTLQDDTENVDDESNMQSESDSDAKLGTDVNDETSIKSQSDSDVEFGKTVINVVDESKDKADNGVEFGNTVNNVDVVIGASNAQTSHGDEHMIPEPQEADDISPSIIIGTLLIVPVLLLVIVTVMIRLYQTGNFWSCKKRGSKRGNKKFNLGNLLNPHKGFDRLSTEDDDHDLENMMDDSDNEEFSIVRKA